MLAHLDRIWPSTWRSVRRHPAPGALRIVELSHGVGLRLAGEVDLATHAQLAEALDACVAAEGGPRDLHVWLGDLRFIDVHGAALLTGPAERLGPDHRVVLHRAPELLRWMIEMFWPELPGLTLDR